MAEQPTREAIERSIMEAKDVIAAIGEDARDNAWGVQQFGLMIRNGAVVYGDKLGGYEAVAHHPVWGEEIREALHRERMSGMETGPRLPEEYQDRWLAMERWEAEVAEAVQHDMPVYAPEETRRERMMRVMQEAATRAPVQTEDLSESWSYGR